MLRNIVFYMIILILSTGCSSPIQEETSVAVIGEINQDNIEIYISKALPASGKYEFSGDNSHFFINDATVTLLDDGVKLLELISLGKGKYIYKDTNWKALPNHKYSIVANVPNYGIVASDNIIFPDTPKISNIKHTLSPNYSSTYNPKSFPQIKLEVGLNPNDKVTYYEMMLEMKDENSNVLTPILLNEENTDLSEIQARACNRSFTYNPQYNANRYGVFFTEDCLNKNIFHELLLFAGYNSNTSQDEKATKLTIRFNAVSESYSKLIQYIRNVNELDVRFQEYPPTYSNINNGVGYVYARNSGKRTFIIE